MERKAYSTDLTDAEWEIIKPFFPDVNRPDGRNGRRRVYSFREIVNGIFYVNRSGCAWNLIPHDLPPSLTCYHYFRKWSRSGLLVQIHDALREQVRKSQERDSTPSAAIIDSQSVTTTQKGGSPDRTPSDTMAIRKSKAESGT